jgi:hypothetical protein
MEKKLNKKTWDRRNLVFESVPNSMHLTQSEETAEEEKPKTTSNHGHRVPWKRQPLTKPQ